jgi:predicted amidohydrolase
VRLPAGVTGRVSAPGAATVIGPDAAEAQYALPMSAPWGTTVGGAPTEMSALKKGAWLVAELDRGADARTVPREAVLKALPKGSALTPLGSIRHGVPEAVDAVVCYDFGESMLQRDERAALVRFAKDGGAVFFVYVSRSIPAASVELWRDVFGAQGKGEKQAAGLPRGLLVPADFGLGLDFEMPGLVWRRCGRGLALAYALPPVRNPADLSKHATVLFERARYWIETQCRPVTPEPFMPEAFGLFDRAEWSRPARRRAALVGAGYAAAAIGLLLSFGSLLARKRWRWTAGTLAIAMAGTVAVVALGAGSSGLALDTASVVLDEPGAEKVLVTFARIARLAPGDAPQLRSATPVPPRLALFSRYSASQKTWANYRFGQGVSSIEPLLAVGESMCVVSVRTLSDAEVQDLRVSVSPAPAGGHKLTGLVRERWAGRRDRKYDLTWVTPSAQLRLFDPRAEGTFVQIERHPLLWVSAKPKPVEPVATKTVRVAAVQCYSRMGKINYNRLLLSKLVVEAAGKGAKIVVLPECAVPGYMDPGRWRVWQTEEPEAGTDVSKVAEPVPGPSTKHFAALAKRLSIYLVVPLIEKHDGKFYNAQVLLDPSGATVAHHRKHNLWTPGDGTWATAGKTPVQVVDTPYGRLGLMICYDTHVLPAKLAKAKADIVLYSVGWYGPNTDAWFGSTFPMIYVAPHNFAVVSANWSADERAPGWPGHGYSCIIGPNGEVLAMAESKRGSEIIIADLPVRGR